MSRDNLFLKNSYPGKTEVASRYTISNLCFEPNISRTSSYPSISVGEKISMFPLSKIGNNKNNVKSENTRNNVAIVEIGNNAEI